MQNTTHILCIHPHTGDFLLLWWESGFFQTESILFWFRHTHWSILQESVGGWVHVRSRKESENRSTSDYILCTDWITLLLSQKFKARLVLPDKSSVSLSLSLQMLSSILFAAVGVLGAGYSVIVSSVAINHGPKCVVDNGTSKEWITPFSNGWGAQPTPVQISNIIWNKINSGHRFKGLVPASFWYSHVSVLKVIFLM